MRVLKVKGIQVDRGWNGPISLSQKVRKTILKKGYTKVQINGEIFGVELTRSRDYTDYGIAWLGKKLGKLNALGIFEKEIDNEQ